MGKIIMLKDFLLHGDMVAIQVFPTSKEVPKLDNYGQEIEGETTTMLSNEITGVVHSVSKSIDTSQLTFNVGDVVLLPSGNIINLPCESKAQDFIDKISDEEMAEKEYKSFVLTHYKNIMVTYLD